MQYVLNNTIRQVWNQKIQTNFPWLWHSEVPKRVTEGPYLCKWITWSSATPIWRGYPPYPFFINNKLEGIVWIGVFYTPNKRAPGKICSKIWLHQDKMTTAYKLSCKEVVKRLIYTSVVRHIIIMLNYIHLTRSLIILLLFLYLIFSPISPTFTEI